MFTIRFNQHHGDGYTSYSCRAYRMQTDADTATVTMTLPDGEERTESVGDAHEHEVAYVTNGDSRTIDVIRAPVSDAG